MFARSGPRMVARRCTGSVNGTRLGQALDWILTGNDRVDSKLDNHVHCARRVLPGMVPWLRWAKGG